MFAYKLGCLIIAGSGMLWGTVFLLTGGLALAAMEGALIVIAATAWLLINRGRFSAALLFSQIAFLLFALVFNLVFDVPSAAAPRVSHLYLLVLAALGYINYLRERSRLQIGVVAACLAAFVMFASAPVSVPFAQPLPDEVRYVGAWVNAILATSMLAGCGYVMHVELERSSRYVHELQVALWKGEFVVYYQGQIDRSGRVIGAEALLRWESPRRGLVPPDLFIPVAEQAGMMVEIGGWVLNRACQTLSAWQNDPATRHLTLAVNVTAGQLRDDSFVPLVEAAVALHGIDPTRLKLELTESMMVASIEGAVDKIEALGRLGVAVALDDFGTGYSALGYLRRLPLFQLKVDRSFVADVALNERGTSLVRNIIRLGHDLGLQVLAEGVETQDQFRLLKASGCDQFQGFLFGRPLPLAQFEASLERSVTPERAAV